MKKEEKATAVAELTEKFGRARLAIVTECVGLPVNHVTELRKQLRGAKAEYRVVKNTLAIRAAEGTTVAGLKAYLKGPTGVVIGYDDPVLPTKILKDFIAAEKREEKIRIMLGVLEGKVLQPAESGGRCQAAQEGSVDFDAVVGDAGADSRRRLYVERGVDKVCESHCSHSG